MTPCEKKTNKKFQMARFCMALLSYFSLTGVVFLYDVISFRMASFSSSKRRDGTNQPPYLLDIYLHLEKGREPFDSVHVLGNQLITGVYTTQVLLTFGYAEEGNLYMYSLAVFVFSYNKTTVNAEKGIFAAFTFYCIYGNHDENHRKCHKDMTTHR